MALLLACIIVHFTVVLILASAGYQPVISVINAVGISKHEVMLDILYFCSLFVKWCGILNF